MFTSHSRIMLFVSIVLLGMLFGTAKTELVCPQGWYIYYTKCYWFSDVISTKGDAKLECKSLGATLATVSSSDINTFLGNHLSNTSHWIGLQIASIETDWWRWSSGFSQGCYTRWCSDVRRYDPETACAVAYIYIRNSYNDFCVKPYPCTSRIGFICEKEKLDASCPTHPGDWKEVAYDSDIYCHYESRVLMDATEAVKFCWQFGARLFTVKHHRDDNHLEDLRYNNVYWIGLSPYRWDDGSPYNWNNWDEYGPIIDDYYQYTGCSGTLIKSDGTWHSAYCFNSEKFICQKDSVQVETTTTVPTTTAPSTSSTTIEYTTSGSITNETMTLPFVKTTVKSAESTMYNNCDNTTFLSIGETRDKSILMVLIGTLSVVIVSLMVAVIVLVVYIKRRLNVTKQPTSKLETPYEDVTIGTAEVYYNVNAGVGIGSRNQIAKQRKSNVYEQGQNGQPDGTYEQIDAGQFCNTAPKPALATYATLK